MERHHSVTAYDVSRISAAFPVRNGLGDGKTALQSSRMMTFVPQGNVQQSTAVTLQSGRIIFSRLGDGKLRGVVILGRKTGRGQATGIDSRGGRTAALLQVQRGNASGRSDKLCRMYVRL